MAAISFRPIILLWIVHYFVCVSAFGCVASDFENILPRNSSINTLEEVQQGGTFGDSKDLDFPSNATNLPPLCAISIRIQLADTSFNFGLFLPAQWNNRLIGTGNTGFGGGINWSAMGRLVYYNMVAFSTDSGHNSNPNDASWALHNDAAIADWASLAMHDSLVLAKQVVEAYYNDKISYSYYMACSGGGRQGMKELQEYPEDFNGYAIGHPPWLLTHLHPWATYVGKVNLPNTSAAHIPEDLLSNLTQSVTDICDPQDGVTDNIVMTPWTCNFNSSVLVCQNSTQNNCLSTEQLSTFNILFSSWVDSNDTALVSPTLMLGSDISGLAGTDTGQPSEFGTEFVDNFIVNQSNWNYENLSPATVRLADSIDPGNANADSYDLSAFQTTGGKVIHYHGLADPLIPPEYSINYLNEVQETMTGSNTPGSSLVDDFYRLFLVPGMHHCSGSGGAPYFIAGGGQSIKEDNYTHSVPGFMDAQHDVVLAVMDWVENGTAPDSIIATKWHDDKTANGLSKQMPLCPYPAVAQHVGRGSIDDPNNWQCQNGTPAMSVRQITIAEKGSVPVNSTATTTTPGSSTTPSAKGTGAASLTRGNCWTLWSVLFVVLVLTIR